MEVTLSSGNRITLPKSVIEELNLAQGNKLSIVVENGTIKLIPDVTINHNSSDNISNIDVKPIVSKTTKRIIESNLQEGANFKKKYYSECGLVIRTKNRYLKDFCKDCNGQLIQQYPDHKCPYTSNINESKQCDIITDNTKSTTLDKKDNESVRIKETVNSINKNIQILQNKLDDELDDIVDIDETVSTFYRKDTTPMFPVTLRNMRSCDGCGEFFNKGFIIDNVDFYCKSCATKDFINYLSQRKEN